MNDSADHIDLSSYGLDHDPLVRTARIKVDPPSLEDNTGFGDRVGRAAARAFPWDRVDVPVGAAADLAGVLVESDYELTVAAHGPDRGPGRLAGFWPEPWPALGLAVDVGSTTLVLALVDLERPAEIDRITWPNPQVEYGADILTRAHLAEKPEGREKLVRALRSGVNQAAARLAERQGASLNRVACVAAAGNTSMTHFLLDLPLKTLIRQPYVPVLNFPADVRAADIGLNAAPDAPVLVMPNKGSYFGGDLISGLVVTGINRAEAPCMMVDVGTNAEVVLGQKDWLLAAAGAAGPALEGGVAARGMIAGPGAIDRVRIDRQTKEIQYRTMGDQPARGICGSGLIDLFAEAFLSGLIDFHGRITLPPGHPLRTETDEGPALVVVPAEEADRNEPVTLSEVEIDILTRSKAGMYTILSTVVMSVGLTFKDIDRFYVAGAFGQYIDPKMAVAVGMLPDLPLERFTPLGNSSLRGAVLALISGEARRQLADIWRKLTYLEMNVNQDLMNRFSAARFIPHTDRSRFPSVGATIV